MKASISESKVTGSISIPSSKSYTIRGLICAALTCGTSEIIHPLGSDDTEAAMEVLGKVGVSIQQLKDRWEVSGGQFHQAGSDLFCRESAATFRFMTAVSTLLPGRHRLTAGPSLSQRPVEPLVKALRQLGVTCSSKRDLPPVVIDGGGLRGGTTELPGDISSQFVSALLMVAPRAREEMTIRLTTPLESAPFVLMTLDTMQWFGVSVAFSEDMDEFQILPQLYHPTRYRVEGDWSSASYPLALGALNGEVSVSNLSTESLQADRKILSILQDMGASVIVKGNSVTVRKSRLKAIKTDMSNCIDMLPTVAVLAATADGVSELTGLGRARLKESDRVDAVREGLERMGITATVEEDRMTITGSQPNGATIDSKDDHRIAMAFALLGAVVGETVIEGAECVSKTYPEFWDQLRNLGVEVTTDGK
ncbi:MAG: 3-phosphoshikimate 1-carboxyvinyltransferase [Dehalococcoidales bacterium]|nr:MAG: 3-phosphoshikimate 1-carboxyvinyltransferase [Dehalococcoidales bacterium]